MPFFRRVEPAQAGPNALGVLIPPGKETLVVVRPKSLAWDFLPARWNGNPACSPEFCRFSREEAPGVARKLMQTLEEAAARRVNPLETFGHDRAYQIWLRTPDFFWIVCLRRPGETYRPLVFASREEAETVGEQLAAFVWPGKEQEQEVYFNTQKFALDS